MPFCAVKFTSVVRLKRPLVDHLFPDPSQPASALDCVSDRELEVFRLLGPGASGRGNRPALAAQPQNGGNPPGTSQRETRIFERSRAGHGGNALGVRKHMPRGGR